MKSSFRTCSSKLLTPTTNHLMRMCISMLSNMVLMRMHKIWLWLQTQLVTITLQKLPNLWWTKNLSKGSHFLTMFWPSISHRANQRLQSLSMERCHCWRPLKMNKVDKSSHTQRNKKNTQKFCNWIRQMCLNWFTTNFVWKQLITTDISKTIWLTANTLWMSKN